MVEHYLETGRAVETLTAVGAFVFESRRYRHQQGLRRRRLRSVISKGRGPAVLPCYRSGIVVVVVAPPNRLELSRDHPR